MAQHRLLVGTVVDTTDPGRIIEQVVAAERHGLNFALFDDGPGAPAAPGHRWALDPVECASFASAATRSIGLVATAAVTHAEPFHLSNRFSSLDWGSSGRAGWLATVDTSVARAQAYSTAPAEELAAVGEAAAVVSAVRALWDSWEDGALIADSVGGRFLDSDKLHYVDAGGPLFSIRGPALMPRPVQGQVIVLGREGAGIDEVDVTLVRGDQEPSGPAFAEITVEPGVDLLGLLRGLAGRVDGVVLSGAGAELYDRVLPALISEGTVVPPRPGQTFRDQLGLPRPISRYTVPAGTLGRERA